MIYFIGAAVSIALVIIEYFLCTRLKSPLWGGIIPVLILAGTIWMFASGRVPLTYNNIFPLIIANIIYWGDWETGREKYKKLQQAEIEKMKAKDI